jgi:hypothetical protein
VAGDPRTATAESPPAVFLPAVRALQLEHRSSPIGEQCVPLSGCIEPRLAPPVVLEPGVADLLVDVYLHKDSASGTVRFP